MNKVITILLSVVMGLLIVWILNMVTAWKLPEWIYFPLSNSVAVVTSILIQQKSKYADKRHAEENGK